MESDSQQTRRETDFLLPNAYGGSAQYSSEYSTQNSAQYPSTQYSTLLDEAAPTPSEAKSSTSKKIITYFCLFGLIATWTGNAELLQYLQTGASFDQPYFLVYFNHSTWSSFFLVWLAWFSVHRRCTDAAVRFRFAPGELRRFVLVAFALCAISFASMYTYYVSLTRTSVSANTAIYNSSPAFVFVLSVFAVKERVTIAKLAGTVACVGGVVVIALFNTHSSTLPALR
jgi:drug/metabolite transporter (DMT)-like permease